MGDVIPFPARPQATPAIAPLNVIAAEFLFDLGDPFTYLLAERVDRAFPKLEWTPVTSLRAAGGSVTQRAEAHARALRLPLEWPEHWPAAVPAAMRVAAYAALAGRGGPFVLAATRLAFAGGYDLEDRAVLTEAAAAAGLVPEAALRAAEDLALGPHRAPRAEHLPALRVGGTLHAGEACLAQALRRSLASG